MKKVLNYLKGRKRSGGGGEESGLSQNKFNLTYDAPLSVYGSSESMISSNDTISIYDPGSVNKGWNKLHIAAWVGDVQKMRTKLRKIAVDTTDDLGRTPLHLATSQGHASAVAFLIACKANTAVQDIQGRTALHKAMEFGHVDCAQLLLDRGDADLVNIADSFGDAPLHVAARNGSYDMSLMLLQKGANLELANTDGQFPLHAACASNTKDTHELIELFLRYGALINVKDKNDVSPLMIASGQGIINIVRLFLEYGANKMVKDKNGKTAYSYAAENHFDDIQEILGGSGNNDDLDDPKLHSSSGLKISQESINVITPPVFDINDSDENNDDRINQQVKHKNETSYISDEEVAGAAATITESNRPDFLSPLLVQVRRNSSKSICTGGGGGDGACSIEGSGSTNNTKEKYETDKQVKMDNESSESDWADDFSLSIKEEPCKLSLKKSPFYVGDTSMKSRGSNEKTSTVEALLSSLKINEPRKEEQKVAAEYNNENSNNETSKGILYFENSSNPVKTIEDNECKLEDMAIQFDFIDENEDTYSCDVLKKIEHSKTVFEIVNDNENQPKCLDDPDNSAQSSALTNVTNNSDLSSCSGEELNISECKNMSDHSEAGNENSRNIKISNLSSPSHCDNTNNESWSSGKEDSEIQFVNPIEKIEKLFSISRTQGYQSSSEALDDGGNSSKVKEFSRVLDIRDLNVSCKNDAKDTASFASPVSMPWLTNENHQCDNDNDYDNNYEITNKSKSSSLDGHAKGIKLLCEVEEASAAMSVDEIWVSNDFVFDKSQSSLNDNDNDIENKADFLNSMAIDSEPDIETKSVDTNDEHSASLMKSTNDTSSSHSSDCLVSNKSKASQKEKCKKNGNIVNGGSTPCRIPDEVTDKIPTFFTDYGNGQPSDSYSSFSRHSEEAVYNFERKKNRNVDRSCLSDPGQLIDTLSRFFVGSDKNTSSSKTESSKNSEKPWSRASSAILQEPEYDFIRMSSNDIMNHRHNYSPHLETDKDFMEVKKLLTLCEIKGAKDSWVSEDNEDEDNEDQTNKDDLEEIEEIENKACLSSEILQKFDQDEEELEMEDEQTTIGDTVLDEHTCYLQDNSGVVDNCKEQDDSSCNFIDSESNDQLINSYEETKPPVTQEDNKSSSLSSKCDSRNLLEHILATQSSFEKDSTFDPPFGKIISNYQNHQYFSSIDMIRNEYDKINNFKDENKAPRSLLEMLKINDSADIKNKKISVVNNFESPKKRISDKVKLEQLKNMKTITNEESLPDNSVKSINDKTSIDQNNLRSGRSIFIKKASRTKRRRNPFDPSMLRAKCNKKINKKSIFSASSNMKPSLNFTNDVNSAIAWPEDTRQEILHEQRTTNTEIEESKETKSVASRESFSERYLKASNTNPHLTRNEPEKFNIASSGSSLISLKNTHSLIDLQPMETNGVDGIESKSDIWSMEVRSSDRSIPERFDERLRLLADLGNSVNNELTNKVKSLRMGNGLTVQSEKCNDRLNVKDNTVTSDQITMISGRPEPVAEIQENFTNNQLDVFQSDVVMLLRSDYHMVEETLKKHNVVLENLTSRLKDEGAVSRYFKEKELNASEEELNEIEKDCRFKALQVEVTILREKLATRRQEDNTKTLEAVVRLNQEKLDLQATINGLNQTLVEHRIDLTELRKENNRWRSEWNVMKNDLEAHMAEVNYLTRRSVPNDPAVVRKITKLEEQNKHLLSNYHNLAKDMELQKVQHRKHLEAMFRQLMVSDTAKDAGNLNTERSTVLRASIASNDSIQRSKSDPLFETRTTQDTTLKIPIEHRATTSVQVSSAFEEDGSDNKGDKGTMPEFFNNDRSTSVTDISNSFSSFEIPAGKKDDGQMICEMKQNIKGRQGCIIALRKNLTQFKEPVRFGVSCKNLGILCNARQFSTKRFSTRVRPVRGNFKKINKSWAKAETYSSFKSKQQRRFGSKRVSMICVDSKYDSKKLNLEKYVQEQIPNCEESDENSKKVSLINIVDAVNTEIPNNTKVSCEIPVATTSQCEIFEKMESAKELLSTLKLKFNKDKEIINKSKQTVSSAEVNLNICPENIEVSSEQRDKNSKNALTTAIEDIVQDFSVLLGSDDRSLKSNVSEDDGNFHSLKMNKANSCTETTVKVSLAPVMGKFDELITLLPKDDKDSNSTIKTESDIKANPEDNDKEEKRIEGKSQQDEMKSLKENESFESSSMIKNCSQSVKKSMVDVATGNDIPFQFLNAAVVTDSKTLPITVSISVGNVYQELAESNSMKDATSTLEKKEKLLPEFFTVENKTPTTTSNVIQKMIETSDKSVGTPEVTESSMKMNQNDRMINVDQIPSSLLTSKAQKKPLCPPTEIMNKILKKTEIPLMLKTSKNTQPLYKSTELPKKSTTIKVQRITKKSLRMTRKGQTLPQFRDIPKLLERNLEDQRLCPKLIRLPKYTDKKKSRTVRFNPHINSSSRESLYNLEEIHGSKKEEFIQGARLFTTSAKTQKSIATEMTEEEQQEVSKDMSKAYKISLDKCNIYGTNYAVMTMRNGESGVPVILIGGGPADRAGPGIKTPTIPCPLHQEEKIADAQNDYNLTSKTPYRYQEYFQYENTNSFGKTFPDASTSDGSEFNKCSRVQQIDRLVDLLTLQHGSSCQDLSKFSENVRRIRDILENRNCRSKYSRIGHQDQPIKSEIKPLTESIERVTAIFDDLETLQRTDVQFHDDFKKCDGPDLIIDNDEMIEPIKAELNTCEKDKQFPTKNKVVTGVRDQSSIRQCRRNLRRSIIMDFPYEKIQMNRDEHLKRLEIAMAKARTSGSPGTNQCSPTEQSRLKNDNIASFPNSKRTVEFKRSRSLDAQKPAGNGSRVFKTVLDAAMFSKDCATSSRLSGSCFQGAKNRDFLPRKTLSLKQNPIDCASEYLTRKLLSRQLYNTTGRRRVSTSVPRLS
ncbi:uncharacterized protein LOC107273356 isoform X2 [Cephus cinctus]|uniref:Uncharacterized protein LOC107273356 isoform X2 n=1 Tax=Cephus cinctus TaxID=211228 RepID=A0AAJ7CBU7_CEPCN|nr:uncharacterized protein LOC107273356 isoform X2 [Cephus cinctus]